MQRGLREWTSVGPSPQVSMVPGRKFSTRMSAVEARSAASAWARAARRLRVTERCCARCSTTTADGLRGADGPFTHGIAFGRQFNLDDIGTEITEQSSDKRARNKLAELHNPETLQWAVWQQASCGVRAWFRRHGWGPGTGCGAELAVCVAVPSVTTAAPHTQPASSNIRAITSTRVWPCMVGRLAVSAGPA
jgi:hypothetical protein